MSGHVTEGDLGELPISLRFIDVLNRNLSLLTRRGIREKRSLIPRTWSSGSTTARQFWTRSS